jgi:hypothetical protein
VEGERKRERGKVAFVKGLYFRRGRVAELALDRELYCRMDHGRRTAPVENKSFCSPMTMNCNVRIRKHCELPHDHCTKNVMH